MAKDDSPPTWRDDALTTVGQDELGTAHLAERIAGLVVETYSFQSSTVIGLTGPYGSGKSSIIAMACERLNQGHPDWSVARFTPWATTDTATMVGEFYATLTESLPTDVVREIRNGPGRLVQASSPLLKLVPAVGEPATDFAGLVSRKLLDQPSWDKAFKVVSARLRRLEKPTLIVVDDVDRLHGQELADLLRVVRLLGRFPGISYLLAYDEQTVFSNLVQARLGVSDRTGARLFMEKIVQYPVRVPPLLRSQVVERINAGLERAFHDLDRTPPQHDMRLSAVLDVLISQLRTPRSLARYLAQVKLSLSLHDEGEIDAVDLALLTLIQVQFPDLYAELPRWKIQLTGSFDPQIWIKHGTNQPPDFDPLVSTMPEGFARDDAVALLAQIFPATAEHRLVTLSRQGVRNAEYFDRYFVHGVPADDVADSEIRAALLQAGSISGWPQQLAVLLTTGSEARASLAVRHMRELFEELRDEVDPVVLLGSIMAVAKIAPRADTVLLDPHEEVVAFAGRLLLVLPTDVSGEEVKTALDRCIDRTLRLEVLWSARHQEDMSPGVLAVFGKYASQALFDAIEHMHQADAAAPDAPVLFWLLFAIEVGDPETVRREVGAAIGAGVSVETVASRFVKTARFSGVPNAMPRLTEVDQANFDRIGPADDALYASQRVQVDLHDLSWQNRRAFVRGRVRRPAPSGP